MVVDEGSPSNAILLTPKPPTGSHLIKRETKTTRQKTSKIEGTKALKIETTATTEINTISQHLRGMAKPADSTKDTRKKRGLTDMKSTSRISVGARTMTISAWWSTITLMATTAATKLASKASHTKKMTTNAIARTSAGRWNNDTQPIRRDGLILATNNITSSQISEAAVKSTPTSAPMTSISGMVIDKARSWSGSSIGSSRGLNKHSNNESCATRGPTTRPETISSIMLASAASSSKTSALDRKIKLHVREGPYNAVRINRTVEAIPTVVVASNTVGKQIIIVSGKAKPDLSSPPTTQKLGRLTIMRSVRFRTVSL